MSSIDTVILITVDSLRYDRLGCAGNPNPCSLAIDGLARRGIFCTRAYAHGFCSQLSYPSIFTSTLPLAYGGYDRGIFFRPRSLPEVLREHGFTTVAFSCDHTLTQYYGYPRGFDEFHALYDWNASWRMLERDCLGYYRRQRQNRVLTDDEYYATVAGILEGYFGCMAQAGDSGATAAGRSGALRLQAMSQLEALRRDPKGYIDGTSVPPSNGRPGRARNSVKELTRRVADVARPAIKSHMGDASLFERYAPWVSRLGFDAARLRSRLYTTSYASATDLMAMVRGWLSGHRGERSFIWMCPNDVHEGYVSSALWSPSALRHGLRSPAGDELERPYLLYDRSVSYVDKAIGDFVEFLRATGMWERTLVVLCADHGRGVAVRDGVEGMATRESFRFAEHIMHVPMLFAHPAMAPCTVERHCGLVDLAPTVLDLLGLAPEPAFAGYSVCSREAAERRYVLAENAGAGPCDLRHKEPEVCVIGEQYKYVLGAGGREELYDLLHKCRVSPEQVAAVGDMREAARERRSQVMVAE